MLEHFVQMPGFDLAVIADFIERASLEFRGELRFDGICLLYTSDAADE